MSWCVGVILRNAIATITDLGVNTAILRQAEQVTCTGGKLQLIEVQLGTDISIADKKKYELD